jgi:hypothetical protein
MNNIKLLLILLITVSSKICYSQFAGGTGTYEDPYLIQTADQLNQVRNYMTSSFRQIADIDLGVPPWNQGTGWNPIGDYIWTDPTKSFRGNYDGGGYKILNMQIVNFDRSFQGLFGSTDGCVLKNINIVNCNIDSPKSFIGGVTGISYEDTWSNINVDGYIKGASQIGLISSFFEGYAIKYCHSIGEIISTGGGFVGGLVGQCNADSIMNCSAEVNISSYAYMTGGLIGQDIDSGYIKDCYAKANITVTDGYNYGGFIGKTSAENRDKFILNCYSEGSVCSDSLNTGNRTGGFIGSTGGYPYFVNIDDCYSKASSYGTDMSGGFVGRAYDNTNISNCYSTGNVQGNTNVGGFIGYIEYPASVFITNCYWDTETSGQLTSAAGEGRTTAEMTLPYSGDTYVGWDFGSVWADDIYNLNEGYPRLQWTCGTSRTIGINIRKSDGSLFDFSGESPDPDGKDGVTFFAYMKSRPAERLLNSSEGCGYTYNTSATPQLSACMVNIGNFPSEWAEGDSIVFVIQHELGKAANGLTKTFMIPGGFSSVYFGYTAGYVFDGPWRITDPSLLESNVVPVETALFQNYPNPFNPVTQVKFALAKTADVRLSVYNIAGQKVAELANGAKNAGYHTVDFDGSRFNSGVYYYSLEIEGKNITKKMLLTK